MSPVPKKEKCIFNPKFEELKASGNLPSPTGVALEILKLTQSETVTIEQLVKPIKADPVLTGRVLKLVNSAAYNSGHPVLALHEAVMRLGINVLSRLALTLSIFDANRDGNCKGFDYANFWATSLLRALAMQAIARHTNAINPEEAFTIGLIAEIGQLALAQIYPVEYSDCLNSHQQSMTDVSNCKNCANRSDCSESVKRQLINEERARFAIDHQQITLAMFSDWGLPSIAYDAVSDFNKCLILQASAGLDYGNEASRSLGNHLRMAAAIAGQLGIGEGSLAIQDLAEQMCFNDKQIQDLLHQLAVDWPVWKKLLSIEGEDPQVIDSNHDQISRSLGQYAHTGLRILLVEDDRIQIHLLSKYLCQQGHKVIIADGAEKALAMLLTAKPQVVIADYRMQPMDGLELCRLLRTNLESQWVYFVLITADQDASTLSLAFQAGVNDFISKPIKQNELDARLLGAQRMVDIFNIRSSEQDKIRNYAFELATTTRKLEILTVTDQLTGLPNRRYAVSRLDQEWANYTRNGQSFAVYSLDLDFFKKINDVYGHDVGDQVLIHFAAVLQKTIRTNDVACRMGGEEFIVISSQSSIESVEALGFRIVDVVEKSQPVDLNLDRLVTVSVGVAICNQSIDLRGWSDTLKRSDQALYEAKASGRNCFKLLKDRNLRKYERFYQKAAIKVRIMMPNKQSEFECEMENLSKGGLFLRCSEAVKFDIGDLVAVKTTETENAEWQNARVVRIDGQSFAVEFNLS